MLSEELISGKETEAEAVAGCLWDSQQELGSVVVCIVSGETKSHPSHARQRMKALKPVERTVSRTAV